MSTGQIAGTVIGAVAGFFIGGPGGAAYGAFQGATVGYAVGGMLDPPKGPTMEGPRLSDLAVQTSTYGAFIPRLYGTVGMQGNVFWLENNKLKEVVKKKSSGGKGGGSSSTTKTYSYFATLAIGLCEGPVDGIRRIWAGPNLIYDAGAGDIDSIIASNATKNKNFAFYLGDAAQLPDSRMQADIGVANTPAYRGLCYIVVKDFALANYGNAIPAFKVEIVKKASTPSTIFDLENKAFIASVYNLNVAGGSGLDARGYMNYFYQAAIYGPVYQVSFKPDGGFLTREIQSGKYSLSPAAPVFSVASSLIDHQGVFVGLKYLSTQATTTWIKRDGTTQMYTWSINPVTISAFAQMDDDINFISYGTAAAGYNVIKLSGESATGAAVTLPAGFNGMMTCFGDIVAFAEPTSGGVNVRLYDSGLVFVEAYTIALSGVTLAFSQGSAGCATVNGKSFIASQPDPSIYTDNVQLVEVDFNERTAILWSVSEPSPSYQNPYRGCVQDLGGVISLNYAMIATSTLQRIQWKLEDQTEVVTTLQEIISAECALTGLLEPADIDVSTLTDSATGYRVAKIGSIRNSIEPLQAIWPFDAVQSGYKIKFQKRGQSSVADIDAGDLGVDEQLRQAREMDSQLPNSLVCNYLDRGRNYDTNQQTWERPSTGAVNTRTLEIPAVLTAAQTAQVIETLGNLYWMERTDFGPFSLPPTYSYLEPSDVVKLNMGYAVYELRLTSVNYKSDGSLECSARLNNASTYTSLAAADDVDDGATVGRAGPSTYLLLDIPVVDDTLQNTPGMVAVMCGYTDTWSSGTIWRSADDGQTWLDIQGFDSPGTFGTTRTALAAHACEMIDRGRSLTIDLIAGTLSGLTEAQVLGGAHYAAYGAHGRWEILRFINATLNADGSYTISGLVRGDKGTEWATGLHVAGDAFVLLDDPDGAFIGMATELLGAPRTYRGITSEADIDSDSSLALTYNGANLAPLSAVTAKALRDVSGNLTATFSRRSRLSGNWWTTGVESAVGETSQAYEIDVMSGATVKRTITASTPAFSYSAANQVTDFGSAQSSITFRIYQLSETIGRGYVREVIL